MNICDERYFSSSAQARMYLFAYVCVCVCEWRRWYDIELNIYLFTFNWTTSMIKNIHFAVTYSKTFYRFQFVHFVLRHLQVVVWFTRRRLLFASMDRRECIEMNLHRHAYYTCVRRPYTKPISTLMKYIFQILYAPNASVRSHTLCISFAMHITTGGRWDDVSQKRTQNAVQD